MDDSGGGPRVKRQKIDKFGRFAALAKLRDLKGSKHKCEVSEEVDNVYDEVDETEYAKRISSRAQDDWIDDDGTGYVEDGREIFDDEDEYGDDYSKSNDKKKDKSKRKPKENKTPVAKGGSSLNAMFSKMAAKKKEVVPKLEADDILTELLGEINERQSTSNEPTALSSNAEELPSQSKKNDAVLMAEYMKSLKQNIKVKAEKQKSDDDDLLLESILKPKSFIQVRNVSTKPAIAPTKEEKIEVRAEPVVADPKSPVKLGKRKSDHLAESDDEFENMDFSILDDEVNQIQIPEVIAQPPAATPSKKVVQEPSDKFVITGTGWSDACETNVSTINETQTQVSKSSSEVIDALRDKSEMKVWYWDSWESATRTPGQIFLFGRVADPAISDFPSVCINIKNAERCLYFLPREKHATTGESVTLMDVYTEFNEVIAPKLNIDTFRSRKVTKKFSFSAPAGITEVPDLCDYLEIRYPGSKDVPSLTQSYKTIAYIFGTRTNVFESFILEKKLKGPCWLSVKNFTINQPPSSWCKLDVSCPDVDSIEVIYNDKSPPAPLSILSVNVRTILNPKTKKNEIVMIGLLCNSKFSVDKTPDEKHEFDRHYCGYSRPATITWPKDMNEKAAMYNETMTMKVDSERALLSWFITKFQQIDPDLILSYDASDCQLDAICERMISTNIPNRSRLGRVRLSNIQSYKPRDIFIGRMICDIKLSSQELVKSTNYDLNTLCKNVLGISEKDRPDVLNDDIYMLYNKADDILKLITWTVQDCMFTLRIMYKLNVLPLALQITNVCGNIMSRTLCGGRSERNEYYLLHAFTEKDFIVPDKRAFGGDRGNKKNETESMLDPAGGASKKKASYAGGLVLDPKTGFYDKYILLMDFNSLYPSIIQEYNICFTTVVEPTNETDEVQVPDSSAEAGVLPQQIQYLVKCRRQVKQIMAAADCKPEQKLQYDIRQKALKLTANSMYGCLGFSHSRFYAPHLAALVTQKGRQILMDTKNLVQRLNYEIVYGDTDSIMVNTNSTEFDQVYKIGSHIKKEVNKLYREIELDIDGVFKRLLLLKKKKYAALLIDRNQKTTQELKGLDIVRRDWSQIAIEMGKLVVDEILSDKTFDEKLEDISAILEKVGNDLREGRTPHDFLIIKKQLTKEPRDYHNSAAMPHVTVAMRMNSQYNRRFKKNDVIEYIICRDGTENSAMQRAYHKDELNSRENLSPDIDYYLASQVHVVVNRLLEVIDGVTSYSIAEMLGIDPTKFKSVQPRVDQQETSNIDDTALNKMKFGSCIKFKFKCVKCGAENEIDSAFRQHDKMKFSILEKCSNAECSTAPVRYLSSVRIAMMLAIRDCIKRFYENWLVCDNPTCNNNTRIFTHVIKNNRPRCLECKEGILYRQYTASDLNNQILYYKQMFDLSKCDQKLSSNLSAEYVRGFELMKNTINSYLDRSQYCSVNILDYYTLRDSYYPK